MATPVQWFDTALSGQAQSLSLRSLLQNPRGLKRLLKRAEARLVLAFIQARRSGSAGLQVRIKSLILSSRVGFSPRGICCFYPVQRLIQRLKQIGRASCWERV